MLARVRQFMINHGFTHAAWDGWKANDCPALTCYVVQDGEPLAAGDFMETPTGTWMEWCKLEADLERAQVDRFQVSINEEERVKTKASGPDDPIEA